MSLEDDLADIRKVQKDYMPDTFDLLLVTDTPDATGGSTKVVTVAKAGVKGRIATVSSSYSELQFANRVAPQTTHVLTLPFGTVIDGSYQVRHVQTGHVYDVTADGSRGSLQTAVRMYLVRNGV